MVSPTQIAPQRNNFNQAYASNIIPIRGGREAANSYPVAAGYTAWMMDEENKMFFIKTNDASGIPSPLREFKYEEVTPAEQKSVDFSKFVTKDDLNEFADNLVSNILDKLPINQEQPRHQNNYKPNRRNNNG